MSAATMLLDPTTPPTSPTLFRALLLGQPSTDGVELLLWPEEATRRDALAAKGVPRLLILGPMTPAPSCDVLEDWVRPPLPGADVDVRCEALRARASCAARPRVDRSGELWFASRRTDLSPGQVPLARLLVRRYRKVVRRDDLAAAHAEAGGQPTEEALKAAVVRLGQRLGPVGLVIRTIRGRGYLLEHVSGCGTVHRSVTNPSDPHS